MESYQAHTTHNRCRHSDVGQQPSYYSDGTTLLPWTTGKPTAWDVTLPDTYAESHIANTAITPGAAAQTSAQKKTDKYAELSNTRFLSFCSEKFIRDQKPLENCQKAHKKEQKG